MPSIYFNILDEATATSRQLSFDSSEYFIYPTIQKDANDLLLTQQKIGVFGLESNNILPDGSHYKKNKQRFIFGGLLVQKYPITVIYERVNVNGKTYLFSKVVLDSDQIPVYDFLSLNISIFIIFVTSSSLFLYLYKLKTNRISKS